MSNPYLNWDQERGHSESQDIRHTTQEAVDKLASDQKRKANCKHEHLDMDGICH
jgi:hypothetical protein